MRFDSCTGTKNGVVLGGPGGLDPFCVGGDSWQSHSVEEGWNEGCMLSSVFFPAHNLQKTWLPFVLGGCTTLISLMLMFYGIYSRLQEVRKAKAGNN